MKHLAANLQAWLVIVGMTWAATAQAEPSAGEQLRAYMTPGPKVDLTQFSHLRPVEVPASIDHVAVQPLGAELLAHARPDLGDVRVVDGNSRMMPFIIDGKAPDQKVYIVADGGAYVILVGNATLAPQQRPIEAARALVLSARAQPVRVEALFHNPDEKRAETVPSPPTPSAAKTSPDAQATTPRSTLCTLHAAGARDSHPNLLACALGVFACLSRVRASRRRR